MAFNNDPVFCTHEQVAQERGWRCGRDGYWRGAQDQHRTAEVEVHSDAVMWSTGD